MSVCKVIQHGPSVIINTFIFYNCCFLHIWAVSLPGPRGLASSPPHALCTTVLLCVQVSCPLGSAPSLPNANRLFFVSQHWVKWSYPLRALCAAQQRHKWAGDLSNRVKMGSWPRDLKTSVASRSKSASWKDLCLHNVIVFTQRFNASIEQKLFS